MTLVVAIKFGEYIFVVSDTEITERGVSRRNIIPGGLKTIVIDLNCTIALAGNYTRGLDLIRSLRRTFLRTRNFDQLIELLRRDSESGECDYIISMHRPYAELRKVWEGQVSKPVEAAWLGHAEIAARLLEISALPLPANLASPKRQDQLDLYAYQRVIQDINMKEGVSLAEGVGGILIFQLGSGWGHTYNGYASVTAWQVPINLGSSAQSDSMRASGRNSFGYSLYAPPERGVPIVSLYFDQAQAGAIYSPLIEDNPRLVAGTLLDMSARAGKLARSLGGVTTNDWVVAGQDFDAIARFSQGWS